MILVISQLFLTLTLLSNATAIPWYNPLFVTSTGGEEGVFSKLDTPWYLLRNPQKKTCWEFRLHIPPII